MITIIIVVFTQELAGDASNFIDLCRYTINSKFK